MSWHDLAVVVAIAVVALRVYVSDVKARGEPDSEGADRRGGWLRASRSRWSAWRHSARVIWGASKAAKTRSR